MSGYERTWDEVREDAEGSLLASVSALAQQTRRAHLRRRLAGGAAAAVQRGVVRVLVLVLDASAAMSDPDYRPTRFEAARRVAGRFVTDFFDHNPLSLLAILAMRNGLAHIVSELGCEWLPNSFPSVFPTRALFFF